MNEISIVKNVNGKDCVSARELYQALNLAEGQFSRWATLNITGNNFAVKDEDFQGFDTMSGGNVARDFALSIDFAKRLCMLARTEKGETIRKYFIECEKNLKSFEIPKTYSQALLLAAKQAETIELQQAKLIEQKPKVEFYDQIIDAKTAINMQEVAGVLNVQGLGRNNLFKFLREQQILNFRNIPYRNYIDAGYFTVKERSVEIRGVEEIKIVTLVNQKGVDFIRRKIEENFKKGE